MLSWPLVILALLTVFVGLSVLVAGTLGALTRSWRPSEQIRRRLAPYSVGDPAPATTSQPPNGGLDHRAIARPLLALAERVVARRGFDELLGTWLEAAGLPLRPAEWLLLHTGTAIAGGLLFVLLSAGSLPAACFGFVLGLAAPWLFLTLRRGRRESAFLAQLPDALQLISSGLKAGYSLPQALDTVVRQKQSPISPEFHRALVEAQLGVPVEDALDDVADRLRSMDFSWVVMAIRIQRDVGGNLAELLSTVANTLRERERLRRQVKVLSAEGRLSGIILGALPVVFAGYLLLARPDYLRPMATPLGIVMLAAAGVLLVVGVIWISRVVRVQV